MEKNKYGIYVLAIFIILIIALLLSSCSIVNRTLGKMFPKMETSCPVNDSKYFFRQAGTKPTKQYLKNHR
jgi:hypothetical protein